MLSFIDLQAQRRHLGKKIDNAIARVLSHGKFIMGPEVAALEQELSAFAGLGHAISCASGTDALLLALMAWKIGPGDAVLVPSFTFAATAEVVARLGATPVFVDVLPDTFNIDPAHLEQAIAELEADKMLRAKAVIVVDLFGQIADYPTLRAICQRAGLKLIADAAQGLGANIAGKQAGAFVDVVATSFFPAKPLGCYGDGGAVLTDDRELAEIMRSLRVHGKGAEKYDNVRIGMNGRLDTIQAAILLAKLSIFPDEIKQRNKVAGHYNEALAGLAQADGFVVQTPHVLPGAMSTWAQYTVKLANRDVIQASLHESGIPTKVYYRKPLHRQTAYRHYPITGGGAGLPVSDKLSQQVLSLPMHPYLSEQDQSQVIEALRKVL